MSTLFNCALLVFGMALYIGSYMPPLIVFDQVADVTDLFFAQRHEEGTYHKH